MRKSEFVLPMEDSDNIWHWCRARKKDFPTSKFQADCFYSVAKIGTLVDHVPPSNIRKGKQRMDPVHNSIPEIDYLKNGDSSKSPISVIVDHISSSGTNSDTTSDHPHGASGPGCQFLHPPMGFTGEILDEDLISYQKKQASRLRGKRRGQKTALKQSGLLSDEWMKGSSDQHTAWNREASMEASSSCSISKVVADNMQLQSWSMNGEIRNLKTVVGSETSSSYIKRPYHPPASKKPRNRSFISETGESHLENENLEAKSEILFRELHLLAEVSVLVLEKEQAGLLENIRGEKEIRKAIFTPTGVSFLQRRVLRRAKSAFSRPEPGDPVMLHNLQGNLSAANSKPLLTADNIPILATPLFTEYSEKQVIGNGVDEDQMTIPQLRCSKRTRSQALPSKYCDSVMQPWKRGTRP